MASRTEERKPRGGEGAPPRRLPPQQTPPRGLDPRWKSVLSAVDVGVVLVDAETHSIVDANPKAMEMIGAEREWIIGATCHKFICPAEKGNCPVSDLKQKVDRCKRVMLTAGGDERPILKTVVPLTLDGRKVFLETLVDLNQSSRAEEDSAVLTTALQTAAAGVVVTDRDGQILWANSSFSSITGYPLSEVIGRKPSLVNSGKHNRRFFEDLWGTIIEGKVWRGDVVNRRKDGTLYTEDMTITPVRIGGGPITHFIAVKHDVTERRKAETHLQRRWRHLHQILEYLPVMMLALDEHGCVAVWNEECERVTGYPSNQMVGNPDWARLLYPDDDYRARVLALSERPGLQHRDWESRLRCRDGSTKTISWSRVGAQAPIPGYANWCLGRDITEKVSLTKTLKTSEKFLTSVFSSIQDGICVMDPNLNVLRSNATMERWHASQMPLVGKKCYEAFHRRLAPCENCPCRTVLQTGVPESCILARRDAMGRVMGWVRLNAFPLHDEETGELKGVIEYVRDITALREAEERARWSQKMEGIGRLASGIAHDFNNLLAVIRGYCQLIEKDLPPDSTTASRTRPILQATERAAALTRQLLLFSRRQVPQPEVLNLNHVISEGTALIRRTLGDRIELRLEADPGLHAIRADRAHLQQLLLNLVANAHDAMPNGGRVSLRTYNLDTTTSERLPALHVRPGKYAVLEVEDTGHGMDHATQEHLFEPFFTTKSKASGAGLGLPVVYGIVSACGGYISVHSQPGEGSTFVILFPETAGGQPSPPSSPHPAASRGRGETLLLVEDEPTLRECMVEVLKDAGFRVLAARDGLEALQMVEEHAIDLVLSDIMMPRMNGLELAKRLTSEHPETRVVLFTGHADEEAIRSSLASTGIPLVHKPFEINHLLSVLQSELAVRQITKD